MAPHVLVAPKASYYRLKDERVIWYTSRQRRTACSMREKIEEEEPLDGKKEMFYFVWFERNDAMV